MQAQRTYSYNSKFGPAGGLYDLSPYSTVTSIYADGRVVPGYPVIISEYGVAQPNGDIISGVMSNKRSNENRLFPITPSEDFADTDLMIHLGDPCAVITKGRVIVHVDPSVESIAYGDKAYIAAVWYNQDTDDEYCEFVFTNVPEYDEDAEGHQVIINDLCPGAIFVTGVDNHLAAIELA